MVFTGQGAQWYAMGRELIEPYPVFKATLFEAESYLNDFGTDWSLTEELMRDAATTRVNQTALSISICVAVQIALVRLLKTWGITPAAVTSHSSGEIAAAYAAGALSLPQAMACAYYRSSCAAITPRSGPKGAMAAVGVGEKAAAAYLERLTKADGKAIVACVNSPNSVTIAGDEAAVVPVLEMAAENGVFARRLKVETGYHSHHMLPIAEPYRQALRSALATRKEDKGKTLDVIFSSPVTGGRITQAKQLADPEHWVGSLLQPVEFVKASPTWSALHRPAPTPISSSK
jgi:acyl transferase domain-containing protein